MKNKLKLLEFVRISFKSKKYSIIVIKINKSLFYRNKSIMFLKIKINNYDEIIIKTIGY